jgi:transglutaminase-like putative cysteine protease
MSWVWVLSSCAVIISFIRIVRNLASVRNITLNLLTIFCLALLIYLSDSVGLVSTMVNLLVIAACLKLINLDTRADYHLVLIVLLFLIACGFIYHQTIFIVFYYFACLLVLFITAFLLNKGALSLPKSIKQSSKMILQAVPIALVLFVVTPRLPPFWQINVNTNTQTGLSEQITPGDIANLAQSTDLVFRAEFDDRVPAPEERYWRSIVLDYFDGKTWRISGENTPFKQESSTFKQNTDGNDNSFASTYYRYLVIAEPNNTRWLYSLDIPFLEQNLSAVSIQMNRQYQLFQRETSKTQSLYIAHSFIDYPLQNFTPETDFVRYLQVPLTDNKRTQAWVNKNIEPNMSFEQKLATLNSYFSEHDFTYTLKPPLMPSSPVDAFLFDNRQGFCSHYASALTYMLRLANVPARIVAGYQGGEEQGENILTVRQYDAHAWVEAYDKNNGWIRFDPTALVAPNRALSGLLSSLNERESALFKGDINGFFETAAFNSLREKLAIIDHNWNQFFLEFNTDAQSSLIKELFGELSKKTLITYLLFSMGVIALFLGALFLPYKKWLVVERHSALQKLFKYLKKKGFEREKHEPLNIFYKRIKTKLPTELQSILSDFVEKYYARNYSPDTQVTEQELANLYSLAAAVKWQKAK